MFQPKPLSIYLIEYLKLVHKSTIYSTDLLYGNSNNTLLVLLRIAVRKQLYTTDNFGRSYSIVVYYGILEIRTAGYRTVLYSIL